MDFWTTVIIHGLAALPPTLAAMAALVTALRTRRDTQSIRVTVNGRMEKLQGDLDAARHALAQKDS